MRLGKDHILKKLLLTTDYMNTINGGMAMVTFNLEKEKDGYVSHLIVPGVPPESIKIEIRDNQLFIFYFMEFSEDNGHGGIRNLPYTLGIMDIPFDVRIDGITAKTEENNIKIILPYNKLAGGFRREISIDRS